MGVMSSQSDRFEAFIRPILDTMQTLPAFVYLISAFYLFGIGSLGAILATVIYSLPPVCFVYTSPIPRNIQKLRILSSARQKKAFEIRAFLGQPSASPIDTSH